MSAEEDAREDVKRAARRRTDRAAGPRQLLDDVRHAPLHPPWKRIRLERNTLVDYRQRPVSATVSVAELYHENSKLFPQLLPELSAFTTDADALRRAVVEERAREASSAAPDLDPRWHASVTKAAAAIDVELFYAVEVRVVADAVVATYEPVSGTFQVIKRLSPADGSALSRSVHLVSEAPREDEGGPLLVILGRFVWNDILLGARGYRRTLLEAGQVARELVRAAEEEGLALVPCYEFADREVDRIMEADGVEEGTVMVLEPRSGA